MELATAEPGAPRPSRAVATPAPPPDGSVFVVSSVALAALRWRGRHVLRRPDRRFLLDVPDPRVRAAVALSEAAHADDPLVPWTRPGE